jgi:hypothetical protein
MAATKSKSRKGKDTQHDEANAVSTKEASLASSTKEKKWLIRQVLLNLVKMLQQQKLHRLCLLDSTPLKFVVQSVRLAQQW